MFVVVKYMFPVYTTRVTVIVDCIGITPGDIFYTYIINLDLLTFVGPVIMLYIENRELPKWQLCCHWRRWRLSKRQPWVPSMTTKLVSWNLYALLINGGISSHCSVPLHGIEYVVRFYGCHIQERKGRQGDCLGRHWERWSLLSTSPVTSRTVTTFVSAIQ